MRYHFLLILFLMGVAVAQAPYVTETEFIRWEIDGNGRTVALVDKVADRNLVAADGAVPFCRIRMGDAVYDAAKSVGTDETLQVSFGDSGVEVIFHVEKHPRYFILSALSLSDASVDELTLLDVPLIVEGTLEESFAASALALNLQTRVVSIPGPSKRLQAMAYKRFGIPGAAVAVAAAPAAQLREVMKEIVAAAEELPRHLDDAHPPIGGPWALDAPINRGSYLFDFGSLTEDTVDAWIALVKDLGFNQIDFHTGTSLRFGDYAPNPKLFPEGRSSVKAVIDKLHDAGIAAGLHTYAFFIAKDTPYVTPVPDPRLGKDATYTLAESVDEAAVFIPVQESTADVSTVTGFFARNSVTLHVGDELIEFSGVASEPPYGFTECKRGAHGTQASAHDEGTPVHKLKECFGLFTPEGDSTLLTEIAANTADVFNECGFDMIYLDALDGEDILAGHEYGWHYGSKFVFDIASRLKRPALFEMSTVHHHLWYVRARMGAWDHPARAHKRFIDLHCAANVKGAGMSLPMNLGWWAAKTWQSGTASVWSEPTYPDDIEYLLGKALGHNMSLSLMGVNPDNIGATPLYQRLMPLFRQYEALRHSGVVPESILEKLRVPGAEFTLEQGGDNTYSFRPVAYHKHKVDSPDPWNAEWKVQNAFDRQPLSVRIEALPSAAAYDSEEALLIEAFTEPEAFGLRRTAEGVEVSLERSTEQVIAGGGSGVFSATNSGAARTGSWAQAGRAHTPSLNMANKPALGLWVHGDGSGALLNLQTLSARHNAAGGTGDHYIALNFTGWRYFTLVEMESERISEYVWPYGDHYSIYREHIDFGAIESFSLWFNDLPPGGSAVCAISPVKALPLVEVPLKNPTVSVNGVSMTFPVEIPCGASLEFSGDGDGILYGLKGEELARVTPQGEVALLETGENSVAFVAEGGEGPIARARVTVRMFGKSLISE